MNRLYRNKLAVLETDIFETRRYSLHPVIREQALSNLIGHESLIDAPFAESCLLRGNDAYNKASLRLGLDLYDCAEAIYKPMVESGRSELANDLANAMMNKAVALENMEKWEESLDHYEQAILLQEDCVVRMGMEHLLPSLLKTIRYRLMTLRDLRRWEEAGVDANRWADHFDRVAGEGQASDALTKEVEEMVTVLRGLGEEDRSELYRAMGERAGRLKELLNDGE